MSILWDSPRAMHSLQLTRTKRNAASCQSPRLPCPSHFPPGLLPPSFTSLIPGRYASDSVLHRRLQAASQQALIEFRQPPRRPRRHSSHRPFRADSSAPRVGARSVPELGGVVRWNGGQGGGGHTEFRTIGYRWTTYGLPFFPRQRDDATSCDGG